MKYDSECFISLRAPNGRTQLFLFSYSVLYSTLGISTVTIVGHILEKHDKNHSRNLDWKQNQFLVYDTKDATEFHSTFVWSRVGRSFRLSILLNVSMEIHGNQEKTDDATSQARFSRPESNFNRSDREIFPVETAYIFRGPGM